MLHLVRLYLDGWLSYDKAEIPLDEDGITYIRGKTGAGKSAVFEAILYLLFGETLRKKGLVTNLINQVLDAGYDIRLEFELDGQRCSIREVRGRGDKDELYFRIEDAEKSDQRKKTMPATRKHIVQTLGMSADEFKAISFLGQRQSLKLVFGTSGERGKIIVEIFALGKYDEAIKHCSGDLEETVSERDALTTKLAEYTTETKNLEQTLMLEDVDAVDEQTLFALEKKISGTEDKLTKIREKEGNIREILGGYAALKEHKEELASLTAEIAELDKKISNAEKPDHSLNELEQLVIKHRKKRADVNARIQFARSQLEGIANLQNECPISKTICPVDVPIQYKEEYEDTWEAKAEKDEEAITEIEEELAGYETSAIKARRMDDLERDLIFKKRLCAKYASIELPNVTKEQEDLAKCEAGKARGSVYLKKLLEQQSHLKAQQEVKRRQEELNRRVATAIAEKNNLISAIKDQLEALNIEIQYLSGALSVFKKAKMYKIDLILDLLNKNVKRHLDRISDNAYVAEFVSQKMDAKGKRSLDELNIMVSDGRKTLPIGMISEGQTTQVGLSVLLGVWETATNLSNKGVTSLWLDEAFGPLSSDIVDRIFDTIVDLSQELGAKSVKIISHRELDSRLFDHEWAVELTNGISQLEIVS